MHLQDSRPRTISTHPLLVGTLLARANARELRRFRRRNLRRRICLLLIEKLAPPFIAILAVCAFLALVWLWLFFWREGMEGFFVTTKNE